MKKLISTNNLSKEEWLRCRKLGITGTDAAAIAGLSKFKSAFAVYQDKTSDDIELTDNERLRQGRDLEEYVSIRFQEETGLKVKRANAIYQNEEHPIMLADFDRIIVGEKSLLECKTVSPYMASEWKNAQIPVHYQLQCQHYLAVSGYDRIYIAALILGQEFIIHKIERDPETISHLIAIEEHFWNSYVLTQCPPPPDGSASYSTLLNRLYSETKDSTINLVGLDDSLDRRREISELMEKLTCERDEIDQYIKTQMQENTHAETKNYSISWIPTTQNRLDTKAFKCEEPDLYKKYIRESFTRRFSVKYHPAA